MFLIFLINFLLAISTTIGMTIIPFLITDSLGLSLLFLGILEGTTEFLSNVFRLINGVLFDKIKNKRKIFFLSTGLAFVSKILLLLPTPWLVLCSKILERISNGAFASPRDAFIAERSKRKGLALSFLSVSKTAGCILGPLIVSVLTIFLGTLTENLRLFVMLCCILVFPTVIFSLFLNVNSVKETPFSFAEIRMILRKISLILVLVLLFFMGRFNDGLLMIYLKQKGFPEWFYLSTISVFNFIMLITSPFIGHEIDKGNFKKTLYITVIALGTFNICFYNIDLASWLFAIFGLVSWGIQRTSAQIVFSSLVFHCVDKNNYGTAIGIFYIISGFATMIASLLAGYIAKTSLENVFIFSGFFSFLTLGILINITNNRLIKITKRLPSDKNLVLQE